MWIMSWCGLCTLWFYSTSWSIGRFINLEFSLFETIICFCLFSVCFGNSNFNTNSLLINLVDLRSKGSHHSSTKCLKFRIQSYREYMGWVFFNDTKISQVILDRNIEMTIQKYGFWFVSRKSVYIKHSYSCLD